MGEDEGQYENILINKGRFHCVKLWKKEHRNGKKEIESVGLKRKRVTVARNLLARKSRSIIYARSKKFQVWGIVQKEEGRCPEKQPLEHMNHRARNVTLINSPKWSR